ncbi:MAG: carboxypeptidase regulatory-like domain-containing protein, partial [Thermoplasmata archaeon]|nr:carboxypeptidase regulatory-like domain-containing protein [Thermoplasmata archaeon]
VPTTPQKTFYIEGYVKDENLKVIKGATITLKSINYTGLEVSTLTNTTGNETGRYKITVFKGDYELWVTAKGYNYYVENIVLNQTLRAKNITLPFSEFSIKGLVLNKIDELDIYLFDKNNEHHIYEKSSSGSFQVKVYKGEYSLLVDAAGYKPYIHDGDIEIVDSGYNVGDITLKANPDEMIQTEMSFTDNDWNKTTLKTTWTLNSDSELFGLEWAGVGGPRFQIDKQFGNGDLNVDNSELVLFNKWLKSNGPYRLYTEDYFEVSDDYYNPTLKTFKSTPSGFGGSIITGQGTMKIVTEMSYTHIEGLEGDAYTVKVGDFRNNEKVTITFPDDFEVTSSHDEDILNMPNYHKVAINYTDGSLTIKLARIEEPIADIGYEPDDYVTILENVSFDAGNSNDPTGKIVNYTWDFDDGNFNYTEKASHNWTAPGIKNVTLTVRDSSDLEDMAYKLITVDDTDPKPKIEFENETGVKIT